MATAFAAGVALAYGSPASAALTADAQWTVPGVGDPTLGSSYTTMAQTFKVLHSGQLSQVDLHYGYNWGVTTKAQIWNVSQGIPVGTFLSSVQVGHLFASSPDWRTFTLTTLVPVTAGQTYAIVLTSTTTSSNFWSYNTRANYTDGKMLVQSRGQWAALSLGSGSAFLFKTYVDTSAGLSIASSQPGTTAQEGTAPTMTGTYTGAVGAVTFQADHGSVQAGATPGTWSWTGDAYDEDAAPSSITVTVTDASGASRSTNFTLAITGAKPTVSLTTGGLKQASSLTTATVSTTEGTTLTLNASATSPEQADQTFTYTWTVNGTTLPATTGASYTVPTTDEGSFMVTVTAKDDGGMVSDPVSVNVVGAEIQPVAIINSWGPADPYVTFVTPLATVNFSGTFNDPAPEAHTFRWDFGDGGTATTPTAQHQFLAAGNYTVRLTVYDDENVSDSTTVTVPVLSAHDALAKMVKSVLAIKSLNGGEQNSLVAKLNAASDAIARGDKQAAHNQLNAFLNELAADLKTNKVSTGDYNALRADAHLIMGAIGTYNRFVEWWPLPA